MAPTQQDEDNSHQVEVDTLLSNLLSNRMASDQTSFLPTLSDGTPVHDFLNPETSPFFAQSDDAIPGNPEDDTPAQTLAHAASEDKIDAVKDLLQQGVEISDETRRLARSPAVWQLLLDHGVEINPYPSAETPLLYVFSTYTSENLLGAVAKLSRDIVKRNDPDLLRWILTKDPKPNLKRALELAAGSCDPIIIDVLLEHGAKIENCLAMHDAATRWDGRGITMLDHLLQRGFDINTFESLSGFYGKASPLCVTAMAGRRAETEWLLEHGADPRLKNEFGTNAVDCAFLRGDEGLQQLLRDWCDKLNG